MAPSTQDRVPQPSVLNRGSEEPCGTRGTSASGNGGSPATNFAPERSDVEIAASAGAGVSARFLGGIAAGLLVTAPLAWLLSYGAALPFFLGVFFFALFGIVIGAVVHRVAAPGRPYARWVLVVGTSIIVLAGWTYTLVKEGREFPAGMAEEAVRRTRDIGDQSREEFRASVEGRIRGFLRERYPPGGVLGYVLWVLDDGVMNKDVIDGVSAPLLAPQRRYWWALRVILSVALLGFGVGSQVFLLRLPRDPPVRAVDATS